MIQNITPNIQPACCIIHQKSLVHCSFTMKKDFMIYPPRPEIESVSKLTPTMRHSVEVTHKSSNGSFCVHQCMCVFGRN